MARTRGGLPVRSGKLLSAGVTHWHYSILGGFNTPNGEGLAEWKLYVTV